MEFIPDDLYQVYRRVAAELRREGIPHAMGGGTALSTYTQHWRGTKDVDLYVVPANRQRAIDAVTRAGLEDYYETLPYDRQWIYRAHSDDTIVDVIWAMANHSDEVDERWINGGPMVQFREERVRLIPAEELIYAKMYVLQRDRCDWPDILNMIQAVGPELDWQQLIDRLDTDVPLLHGALAVFCWLEPERATDLPGWVLERFGLMPGESEEPVKARADLLDRRPWYVPTILSKAA